MTSHRAPARRGPWRAVARTVLQAAVGAAAAAPDLVHAAGLPDAAPRVAAGVAVCAALTRVMNTDAVEAWLHAHAPWLASAAPVQAAHAAAAAIQDVRASIPASRAHPATVHASGAGQPS